MPEQRQLPKECAAILKTIEANVNWINNTDVFLEDGENGYEEQQQNLSFALRAIRQAFQSRPPICEMTEDGEDKYDCGECMFNSEIL